MYTSFAMYGNYYWMRIVLLVCVDVLADSNSSMSEGSQGGKSRVLKSKLAHVEWPFVLEAVCVHVENILQFLVYFQDLLGVGVQMLGSRLLLKFC